MSMPLERKSGFNIFSYSDEITISRLGKDVQIKGRDGTNNKSDTVEANLLYEILKALKAKK